MDSLRLLNFEIMLNKRVQSDLRPLHLLCKKRTKGASSLRQLTRALALFRTVQGNKIMKKVTFDTNVIGAAFKSGSNVHAKIKAGTYLPFVAEPVITLDGLNKSEKIDLLALKKPNFAFNQSRWDGFLALGVTFLICPRIGCPRPTGKRADSSVFEYALEHKAPEHTYSIEERQSRYFEVLDFIEQDLNSGQQWLKALEAEITKLGGVYDPKKTWFKNLADNEPKIGEKVIRKRFGDWADADSIAGHYAYGNDLFCTNDGASGAGANSVMSQTNRDKLTNKFGIKFVKLDAL